MPLSDVIALYPGAMSTIVYNHQPNFNMENASKHDIIDTRALVYGLKNFYSFLAKILVRQLLKMKALTRDRVINGITFSDYFFFWTFCSHD
jgi:hypothetical protein